jgi:hypothetical protein
MNTLYKPGYIETEISIGWACENPELFKLHYENFISEHEKDCEIGAIARSGFLTLTATLKPFVGD